MAVSRLVLHFIHMAKNSLQRDQIAERFRTALNAYMMERGMNHTALAQLLKTPENTVRCWLLGEHTPPRARLRNLCTILDWDFGALFDPTVLAEATFERSYLSLDVLAMQYRQRHDRSRFDSLMMLSIGATVLFNRLQAEGLMTDLRITREFHCRLTLLHPKLEGLGLLVQGGPDKSMIVQVLDDTGQALPGTSWPLSDFGVQALLAKLKTFNWTPDTAAAPLVPLSSDATARN